MAWYERASGSRLWYEERGAGTALVLLHGWCMSSAVWCRQLEGLSDSFRVITLDLPGHGQSTAPTGGFHVKGCASDLAGFFESLELQDALLAGWSLGSLIALESFELVRRRLSGLVLIAATPRFTQGDDYRCGLSRLEVEGMARKVQRSLQRARDGFNTRMFAPGELDDPQQAAMIKGIVSGVPLPSTEVALQALDALVESDLRDRLASIDRPTLILNGDCDPICPPQASEYLMQRIVSARQTVFVSCGHAPFLTQDVYFNACLKEFRGMVSGRTELQE